MEKKILFIDYKAPLGHINFNRIQLVSLLKCGSVDCIFKEGYADFLKLDISLILSIPNSFYKEGNRFTNRYSDIKKINYIKRHVDFSQYDKIIISYYEEISFFFSRISSSKIILFNHRNIADLNNFIKRFFLIKVSKRVGYMAVFNDKIFEQCCKYSLKNALIIPHGVPNKIQDSLVIHTFKNIQERYKKIIFSPSILSDHELIIHLLESELVNKYLRQKNWCLIIKGTGFSNYQNENIIIIDYFLNENDYIELFYISHLILLAYPSDFKDCVSSVFSETIANNKFCILSGTPALKEMSRLVPYNCIFQDDISFLDICENISQQNSINYDTRQFQVDWKLILDEK